MKTFIIAFVVWVMVFLVTITAINAVTGVVSAPLRHGDNYKNGGETSQISFKSCNRLQLSQPPSWLMRYVLPLAGILGIFGLILLFGSWRHQSPKQQDIGFLCFAVGIATLASMPLVWEVGATIERLLTSFNCSSENVNVIPVIIAELELGDIQRHIFPAHFVERADNATLENRPEAFDGLSVNCANDILPSRMVNSRVWVISVERIVAGILIGAKQADFMRDGFANERGESGGIHVCDHARNHIPLSADGADDWRLAGPDASRSRQSSLCDADIPSYGDGEVYFRSNNRSLNYEFITLFEA